MHTLRQLVGEKQTFSGDINDWFRLNDVNRCPFFQFLFSEIKYNDFVKNKLQGQKLKLHWNTDNHFLSWTELNSTIKALLLTGTFDRPIMFCLNFFVYQIIISNSGIPDKVRMASLFENSTAKYSMLAPSWKFCFKIIKN